MKFTSCIVALCATTLFFSPAIFAQKAKAAPDTLSLALYERANETFVQGDVEHAIVFYRQLMDREKARPSLPKVQWHTFVNNFGMAYGITRKLDNAEEIFRYGIARDSTYPLFYYNLACTYGERGDMKNSIKYLKIAFKYKEHRFPGEILPDPLSVNPFERFSDNRTFIDSVKAMRR
ncbi:MAG TPA: hypothetical protein VK569_09980 [Bacteroidota bacterium]|nr:hypothetical protein [Bacteroidota bacterium]